MQSLNITHNLPSSHPNPKVPPISGNACNAFSLYLLHDQVHPDFLRLIAPFLRPRG